MTCDHRIPFNRECDDCSWHLDSIRADEHPERVFAWIALAALGWLAAGLLVWRLVR